ncbi:MAG: chromosomal replication initiator protein DnaA [Candidatus Hydrogenedentota bacterium]
MTKQVDPWVQAQGHLQNILDEHSYKNWFAQTRFKSYDGGMLTIQVPSQFFAKWLRDHYMDAVSQSVKLVLTDFKDIKFVPSIESTASRISEPQAIAKSALITDSLKKPRRKAGTLTGFNDRYSFERFIVGSGNRFAYAAAKAVVESPARAYNPLFLYGQTGLGKTHLMQAIGREVYRRKPNANVVYISSEQFTNQLIESIAKKSTQRFRAKYRKVDYLLIDDIHFIAGKEATQEEFFHTFNELFDMHKQIVLSSDRGPKEIQGLEERLVSRFEWGLVTDIQPPDVETRMAILQNKAAEDNIHVGPDILRYIASCVTSNIRELEGALITVVAYGKLTDQPVNMELAEQVLHDLIGSAKIKPISVEGIQRTVGEHFDVRISDLRSRSRQRQVSYPRQVAMFLCKDLIPNLTLKEIGESFGGKDHTTVLYACQKIDEERQVDLTTRQLLVDLEKGIRA